MAKDQNLVQSPLRRRPAAASNSVTVPAPAERKKRTSPTQFLREVQMEARKVTWTRWKETWITSVMVGIMVVLTAVFFFGIDWVMGVVMQAVLKFANPAD
ncbi:MAG TPA: preprotein translocase subunit SecE [Caulobacteraceae bacterium]|jgi:preprotein translocase subunit SecE|nr:preprotein translocase subunit SecE [Caulobacteraceae bacterium]